MNVEQLDNLFHEYGYEAKEKNASYRVYVLNQGMYHGAEVVVLDDCDVERTLEQYSRLGYHAKKQEFKSIDDAENYLFCGFFNTQTTESDINKRYSEYAANQVKHYCDTNIKYQFISTCGLRAMLQIYGYLGNWQRKTRKKLTVICIFCFFCGTKRKQGTKDTFRH
ncbi:MAG: hypothetical protein IJ615_08440 [Bacteroidaceae bacterium]|nr:hypothetical protein [Bacteroidaceae bacterium]